MAPGSLASFVLKRSITGQTSPGGVPLQAGPAPPEPSRGQTQPRARSSLGSAKAPAPPTVPTTGSRRGKFDAASSAILKVMFLAAKQLLGLVGAVPKWTNVCLVLEAGDGSAASPFYGQVIQCASSGTEASLGAEFCKDWWEFRGRKEGRRHEAKTSSGAKGSQKNGSGEGGAPQDVEDDGGNSTDQGQSGAGKRNAAMGESGDGASSGSTMYPQQEMLTRSAIKGIVGGGLGRKTLSLENLRKVLFIGGLEDIKQITYGDVEDIYACAASVLRERCVCTAFSWARASPCSLLANKWSSRGHKDVVDGADFLPPNHRSSRGQGVGKKRLAVCVAVHLSPFYAKVFEQHFAAVRLSGQKKRYRPKDPFADSKTPAVKGRKKRKGAGAGGKLTRVELAAAAAKARLRAAEAKSAAEAVKQKATAAKAADAAKAARATAAATEAAAADAALADATV